MIPSNGFVVKTKCTHAHSDNPYQWSHQGEAYESPYSCKDCRDTGYFEVKIDPSDLTSPRDVERICGRVITEKLGFDNSYNSIPLRDELLKLIRDEAYNILEQNLLSMFEGMLESTDFEVLKNLLIKSFGLRKFHKDVMVETAEISNIA